jgi:hypothetical protein
MSPTAYCRLDYAANGLGDWSEEYVDMAPPPPNAPPVVRLSAGGPTAVRVTWDDVSDNEDGFRVFFWPRNSQDPPQEILEERDSESKWVYGLQPDTEYCANVAVRYHYGEVRRAAFACVRTPPRSGGGQTIAELYPHEVFMDPSLPDPFQNIQFYWRECNSGTIAAGPYKVKVYVNGALTYTGSRTGLAAGTCVISERVNGRAPAQNTNQEWKVFVDADNQVAEAYENNNVGTYVIRPQ